MTRLCLPTPGSLTYKYSNGATCGQYGAAFPINPPLVEVGIHVDKPNESEHESYWVKKEVKYRLGATYQSIIALAIRPCRFTRDREPTRIEIQVMVFQWVTRALYKLTKEPYFYITPDNQYHLRSSSRSAALSHTDGLLTT
jgi:hypothetical protein